MEEHVKSNSCIIYISIFKAQNGGSKVLYTGSSWLGRTTENTVFLLQKQIGFTRRCGAGTRGAGGPSTAGSSIGLRQGPTRSRRGASGRAQQRAWKSRPAGQVWPPCPGSSLPRAGRPLGRPRSPLPRRLPRALLPALGCVPLCSCARQRSGRLREAQEAKVSSGDGSGKCG